MGAVALSHEDRLLDDGAMMEMKIWRLARVLTGKRLELLRYLHRHPARSIAELARALGRDYKQVHADVQALAAAGLIDRTPGGLRADYGEIRTTIAV